MYCDNATALLYLRNKESIRSPLLNQEAQRVLRWAEKNGVTLVPPFVMGKENIITNTLSHSNHVISLE